MAEKARDDEYVIDFGNSDSINPNRREFLNIYKKAINDNDRFLIEDSWTGLDEYKVALTVGEIVQYLEWKSGRGVPTSCLNWFLRTFGEPTVGTQTETFQEDEAVLEDVDGYLAVLEEENEWLAEKNRLLTERVRELEDELSNQRD